MNKKWIKVLGIAATGISVVAGLVTNWVNEKQFDAKVSEKVTEKLAEMATKTDA